MTEWYLEFTHPYVDGWLDAEDKLATLIEQHGGKYDGGGTDFNRRDTYGIFPSEATARECGAAAHYLYIQYLSWTVDPIQEGTQEDV